VRIYYVTVSCCGRDGKVTSLASLSFLNHKGGNTKEKKRKITLGSRVKFFYLLKCCIHQNDGERLFDKAEVTAVTPCTKQCQIFERKPVYLLVV